MTGDSHHASMLKYQKETSFCNLDFYEILGVVTASPEVGSSCVKIDVAFFGWFWLIVESENIFCLQRPLRANSSAAEVKKEHVEAFAYESFYLLLLFFLSVLLFLSTTLFFFICSLVFIYCS